MCVQYQCGNTAKSIPSARILHCVSKQLVYPRENPKWKWKEPYPKGRARVFSLLAISSQLAMVVLVSSWVLDTFTASGSCNCECRIHSALTLTLPCISISLPLQEEKVDVSHMVFWRSSWLRTCVWGEARQECLWVEATCCWLKLLYPFELYLQSTHLSENYWESQDFYRVLQSNCWTVLNLCTLSCVFY